jgi:uncharacterized protein YkwD
VRLLNLREGAVLIALAGCRPAYAPAADPPPPPPISYAGPAPDAVLASAPRRGRAAAGKPGSAPSAEAQAMVDAHNRARARHCARPLSWSAKLAQVAQQWANTLRDKGCMFGHSSGSYGENLAAGTSGTLDPEAVVGMWYDEVAHYKFPDGGFSMKTGHFTQVVWRGTAQVGCGRSQCKGMDIWVCEYDPAGNWEGQYRENVLPLGCRER